MWSCGGWVMFESLSTYQWLDCHYVLPPKVDIIVIPVAVSGGISIIAFYLRSNFGSIKWIWLNLHKYLFWTADMY